MRFVEPKRGRNLVAKNMCLRLCSDTHPSDGTSAGFEELDLKHVEAHVVSMHGFGEYSDMVDSYVSRICLALMCLCTSIHTPVLACVIRMIHVDSLRGLA